jgi:hypothetical protein
MLCYVDLYISMLWHLALVQPLFSRQTNTQLVRLRLSVRSGSHSTVFFSKQNQPDQPDFSPSEQANCPQLVVGVPAHSLGKQTQTQPNLAPMGKTTKQGGLHLLCLHYGALALMGRQVQGNKHALYSCCASGGAHSCLVTCARAVCVSG